MSGSSGGLELTGPQVHKFHCGLKDSPTLIETPESSGGAPLVACVPIVIVVFSVPFFLTSFLSCAHILICMETASRQESILGPVGWEHQSQSKGIYYMLVNMYNNIYIW